MAGPFTGINQAPPTYSMLQYIGRVATRKLEPRNSQILANNIDNGGKGDWSQNLCEVLPKKINEI